MSKGDLADEEIVRACLQGEGEAWSSLVRRYDKLVYNIGRQSGLSADDSADVCQSVFVTIYKNLHLLERPSSLRSWISVIARREAWLAKRQLAGSASRSTDPRSVEAALEIPATGPLPDEEMERLERRFLIHRALEHLDDRCRRLLELLFLRNPTLSYEESAQKLGIPRGSMGPTRARCLEKLRKVLEELGF